MTGRRSNPSVGVHFGNGDGTFDAEAKMEIGVRTRGEFMLGDLDDDGKLDLAMLTDANRDFDPIPTLTLRFGDGQGGFSGGFDTRLAESFGANGPLGLRVLDNDGDLDIAAATFAAGSTYILILLNDGEANFTVADSVEATLFPTWLALGDLDGEARLTPSGLPDLGQLVPTPAELDWV